MTTIYGMKIIESPLVLEIPKLQLSADFTACSDAVKRDMNKWLLERFGTFMPIYVVGSDTLVMSPKQSTLILRAVLKGGAR